MNINELTVRLRNALSESGIENACSNSRFEAEQLLLAAGISKNSILYEPREEVAPERERAALKLLEKRLSGYPLQYLAGDWDFYACRFKVGEGVLIPRQDTETLAELADEFLKKRPPERRRVLDLCAGSGCIGIALAKACGVRAVCVEKSQEAFPYLKENIALNGAESLVTAVRGDIFSEEILQTIGFDYDAIVSNPPYLTTKDMENLQREVTYEPREALFGGGDGLDFYRGIAECYSERLAKGGLLAVEVGLGQAEDTAEIFKRFGFAPRFRKDLCGVDRVVFSEK